MSDPKSSASQDAESVGEYMARCQEEMPSGAKMIAYAALGLSNSRGTDPASSLAATALQYAARDDEELDGLLQTLIANTPRQPADTDTDPSTSHTVFIKSVTVRNWRSFLGEHTFDCSTHTDKPLTLLFGTNGAGKTSLLNAFTWCLFGSFTAGFREQEELLNHEVEWGQNGLVRVKLLYDSQEVIVTRHIDSPDAPTVLIDGKTKAVTDLHRMFPPALKDMFFFPAETFSNAGILAEDSASATGASLLPVRNSILSLLSGERYKQCEQYLAEAKEQDALKQRKTADRKVRTAHDAYLLASVEYRHLQEQLQEIDNEVEGARLDAQTAKEEASEVSAEAVKAYTDMEEYLKSQLDTANELMIKTNRLCEDIFATAPAILISGPTERGIRLLDEAERRGVVPPLIDPRILQRSLDDEICLICETPFDAATATRFEMLQSRALQGISARPVLDARAALVAYEDNSRNSLKELRLWANQIIEELAEAQDHDPLALLDNDVSLRNLVDVCRVVIERLGDLQRHWRDLLNTHRADKATTENQDQLLNIWRNKENHYQDLLKKKERLPEDVENSRTNMEEKLAKWEAAAGQSEENQLRIRADYFLTSAMNFFYTVYTAMQDAVRTDVEREINAIYGAIVDKPYQVEVSNLFGLRVVSQVNQRPIGISQAESVLLLLAFIAAVSRLAPIYDALRAPANTIKFDTLGKSEGIEKGGLPIVIDAPVSVFDERYEERSVNEIIPDIAHQAVVFVTRKAIDIWSDIDNKVGRSYLLCLTGSDQVDDFLIWRDTTHQYTVRDAGTSGRTSIVSI